ncbi:MULTISPECIES: hypothetical protein [Rhodopseudomonas]|uniref:Uncharacterized protein n=1 Tax=Rhodopseudomonas palustris TaxID=1076 RepID=A0A0D7E8W5_RHOPL|nr:MULTISPECIES: hypothetical protein [Rhodopseudomonas]KIZ36935.1 hypothetical protein OO17_24170 [Rhodopseudomonas palustris]MDF3813948.1 hypothetical protein [Rhodopseudomonas sp. BAL398]WOK15588.1 hypothetical protein RBJ75_15495 [Rhodopseudomonas sp. BAL398]
MSDSYTTGNAPAGDMRPLRLRDALRKARIEAADRTGVVVDLRDAEVARLEILNEALDPLFAQIPAGVELFDRGISQGEPPRLWIDVVAHVVMGRDKRIYRFVQDSAYGRVVLAESHEAAKMVDAVTDYVARRLIERERALAAPPLLAGPQLSAPEEAAPEPAEKPRRSGFWSFALGFIAGALALFGLALFATLRNL